MKLTDAIYKIEYTLAGQESYTMIDENDKCDLARLTVNLTPVITLFDYSIEIDGREITLDEIDVVLVYKVIFDFNELDIVNGKCSYNVNVDFLSMHVFNDVEKIGLRKSDLKTQIEADIREGRNIVLDEPVFKVRMNTLQ